MWSFLFLIVTCNVFIHSVDSQIQPELKSVLVGGCVDATDNKLIHCAAVEDECEQSASIRFKTAKELQTMDLFECTTDTLLIGNCKSTGQCAITKDSCDDSTDFTSSDLIYGGCNAEGRFVNDKFVPTQYGACLHGTTRVITCVLTPADCSEKEAWISASVAKELKNGGCRCHDVNVGVCKDGPSINPMLSNCAISADDCHPLVQTFSTARDVMDHALLDCRLCPYHETLVGESNNESTNEKIVDGESAESLSESDNIKPSALSGIKIAFIVVGCTMMTTIVVILGLWYRKRKKLAHDIDKTYPDIDELDTEKEIS